MFQSDGFRLYLLFVVSVLRASTPSVEFRILYVEVPFSLSLRYLSGSIPDGISGIFH